MFKLFGRSADVERQILPPSPPHILRAGNSSLKFLQDVGTPSGIVLKIIKALPTIGVQFMQLASKRGKELLDQANDLKADHSIPLFTIEDRKVFSGLCLLDVGLTGFLKALSSVIDGSEAHLLLDAVIYQITGRGADVPTNQFPMLVHTYKLRGPLKFSRVEKQKALGVPGWQVPGIVFGFEIAGLVGDEDNTEILQALSLAAHEFTSKISDLTFDAMIA